MRPTRRSLLLAATLAPGLAPGVLHAQGADPRLAERSIGAANAPVRVVEYFSLTCSHCATFHRETLPQVKRDLVETGQVRLIWRDFPLDQLALLAAAVARSLPAERYEPFIGALLSSQDRWAFTRGDAKEELAKMAALAGMPRARFDEVTADQALLRAIFQQRETAAREHQVESTPTFLFNNRKQAGSVSFDRFRQLVEEARRG